MITNGLMARLRDETRAEHESVEEAFDAKASPLNISTYHDLLQRFHRVVAPIEERAEEAGAFEALGLDLSDHQRRHNLARDIRFLGFEPARPLRFDQMTVNQGVGALYVLEGSTLGGQVIARLVRNNTSLVHEGIEYFVGHGKQTAVRWRRFAESVDRWGQKGTGGPEVLMSARRTFQAFERSLRQIS